MAKNLTAKQEAFVQAYLRTGHQRTAYRAAYDAENMTDAVVDVKASELMRNGKVSVRIAEMQERTAKRTEITVETITAMLGQTYKKAAESRNHAACVAAAMGLAKVHGLIIDHKNVNQRIDHRVSLSQEFEAFIRSLAGKPAEARMIECEVIPDAAE